MSFFALRPTAVSSAGTGWEITFEPVPDGIYVLSYEYKIQPGDLGPAEYPLGGTTHAETVLASCLSMADPRKFKADFMEKLAGSIGVDRRTHSVETLGAGVDAEHQTGMGLLTHSADNHIATYDQT